VGKKRLHPFVLDNCVTSTLAREGVLAVGTDADGLGKQVPRVTAHVPTVPNAAATAQCGNRSGWCKGANTCHSRMSTSLQNELRGRVVKTEK
jgi:hypothetical protein